MKLRFSPITLALDGALVVGPGLYFAASPKLVTVAGGRP